MESDQPPQYVPPGHYCSPIPSIEDIERAITTAPASYSGIDLREDQQLALLEKLSDTMLKFHFQQKRTNGSDSPFTIPLLVGRRDHPLLYDSRAQTR